MSYIALSWFTNKTEYDAVKVVAGVKDMPSTFDEWKVLAEKFERRETAKGIRVIRSIIKADEFFAFCSKNGLNVDSKARIRYATHWAESYIEDQRN